MKGRNLASPSSREIRPTADRLRESVFNILVHAYDNPIEGARVLDLFAGTGALGIEAVSRGAAFTLFVGKRTPGKGSVSTRKVPALPRATNMTCEDAPCSLVVPASFAARNRRSPAMIS